MSCGTRAEKARESYKLRKVQECPDCYEKFTCNFNLEQHTRSKHTGEKPYVCHLCFPSRGFVRRWLLNRHTKDLHPDQVQEVTTPANSIDASPEPGSMDVDQDWAAVPAQEGLGSPIVPINPALLSHSSNKVPGDVNSIPGLEVHDPTTWTMLAPPPSSPQEMLYFTCAECPNSFKRASDLHFHSEYDHPYIPSVSSYTEEPWLAAKPEDDNSDFKPEKIRQDYIARCPRD